MPTGAVLVDKPAGPTSHDVVAACRRALGGVRAGHTGTLDPFATGLMVVLTGRATRLAPFLSGLPKGYRAGIALGARSESGDPEGPITAGGAVPASVDAVRDALAGMVGDLTQVVPGLSAVKVGGERLYAITRRGGEVERPTRAVVVERADLVSYDPMTGRAEVDIRCSAGTYVRQIAVDLGEALGCGGYCATLRRTAVGHLGVDGAIAPDAVGSAQVTDALAVLGHIGRVDLDPVGAAAVVHGRPVPDPRAGGAGPAALVADGHLVAIAEADAGVLRPRVVLAG